MTDEERQAALDDYIQQQRLDHSEDPVANITFVIPENVMEPSIQDETPRDLTLAEPEETTYEIITTGSQKGKQKLTDSIGYMYTVKRKNNNTVDWTCSVRNKNVWCKASVKQRGNTTFSRGPQPHICQPQIGATATTHIRASVKQKAAAEIFTSAAEIVNQIIQTEDLQDQPIPAMPKIDNLARAANRHRQKMRPKNPTSLDFEIEDIHTRQFSTQFHKCRYGKTFNLCH